jgi:hypothetical protein
MARYDALELHLIDEKSPQYVRIPEGESVDAELSDFISRTNAYESEWVKVRSGQEGDRYVRYDRIVSVEVRRGLDDELVGITTPAV